MIVRISGEGQYRLADADAGRLNELEQELASVVEAGDSERFPQTFAALLDYARSNGTLLADEELETSDVILPPPDASWEDLARDFTGEGLIPQ